MMDVPKIHEREPVAAAELTWLCLAELGWKREPPPTRSSSGWRSGTC